LPELNLRHDCPDACTDLEGVKCQWLKADG